MISEIDTKIERVQRNLPEFVTKVAGETPSPAWNKFAPLSSQGRFHHFKALAVHSGYIPAYVHAWGDALLFTWTRQSFLALDLLQNSVQSFDLGHPIHEMAARPHSPQFLLSTTNSLELFCAESRRFRACGWGDDVSSVNHLAFVPQQSEKAVLALSYGQSKVYDIEKQKACFKLDVHRNYNATACNTAGVIALTQYDIGVVLYDLRTQRFAAKLGKKGLALSPLCFCGDLKLAAGSSWGQIHIWELRNSQKLDAFDVERSVSKMSYSPTQDLLLASSPVLRHSLYDIHRKFEQTLWLNYGNGSACFSESGSKVFVALTSHGSGVMEFDLNSRLHSLSA